MKEYKKKKSEAHHEFLQECVSKMMVMAAKNEAENEVKRKAEREFYREKLN